MDPSKNLRNTGVEIIGAVPWGTHFCQFYRTKEDLLDILIPYFKAGLESNELCVWVTSDFLNTEEATEALRKNIPDFSKYVEKKQIEIFPHTEWYLKGGNFEMKRVLGDWLGKHDDALTNGFAGTRVSGNPFWIDCKKDWDDFAAYEAEINNVIGGYKLVVLCTYSLEKCGANEIIDVVTNHEFALIKREGKWHNIESAGHKLMEEALRASLDRYHSFIEVTGQLAWTTNPAGEVVEDIPEWRRYTGQALENVRGWGRMRALHPDDIEHTEKAWKQAVEKKCRYEVEYRVRSREGFYRTFMARGMPVLKRDGTIREWVGTSIDITERKAAEMELKRSNESLEQFAYAVSHDLQAPLQIVAGYAELLQERHQNKLDPEAAASIRSIQEASRRMQKLIKDILAYARIGREGVAKRPIDCNEIVAGVIKELSFLIESSHGSVTIDSLPVLTAYEANLTQLFQNLVGNALKFRGVEPPKIHIGARKNGQEWTFFVQDNGLGIEPQYHDKIFGVFQRLLPRSQYPGSGIGLSVCQRIVSEHGGKIWVESVPHRGSTFYFTIPQATVS